jgi:hypothetical protein
MRCGRAVGGRRRRSRLSGGAAAACWSCHWLLVVGATASAQVCGARKNLIASGNDDLPSAPMINRDASASDAVEVSTPDQTLEHNIVAWSEVTGRHRGNRRGRRRRHGGVGSCRKLGPEKLTSRCRRRRGHESPKNLGRSMHVLLGGVAASLVTPLAKENVGWKVPSASPGRRAPALDAKTVGSSVGSSAEEARALPCCATGSAGIQPDRLLQLLGRPLDAMAGPVGGHLRRRRSTLADRMWDVVSHGKHIRWHLPPLAKRRRRGHGLRLPTAHEDLHYAGVGDHVP